MRFILVHKTVTYLMVVTSTLSVLVSGEVSYWIGALFLAAVAGSWFWEAPRVDPARWELPWNVATVGLLAALGFQVAGDGSLLSAGVVFILFLLVNKLYNRRTSRDYLQLYVLSFMQLVAGTALDVDITYGLQFVLYVIFGTWTLILFHLKREMEDNFLLKYGDSLQGRPVQVERVLNSRKLVGGRFLLATSAISLLVFLGSTLVFVMFPRIGFGLFFKKQRPGILMTGFSDRVELGQFGTVKDDPTVVLRVEFPDLPAGGYRTGYWRGVSFDHYDGRRWTKSHADTRPPMQRGARGRYTIAPAPPAEQVVTQEIYLEPMETHVLFALSRPHAFGLPDIGLGQSLGQVPRRLFRDAEGDVLYAQADDLAFRYQAFSGPDAPSDGAWQQPLADYRARLAGTAVEQRYLQRPPELDPEVERLAARLVAGATTVGEAVERIETYLRTTYAYSLELTPGDGRPPLEDFLFEQKKGHCEYFATALAILLRTQGIAARNVNGFLGGRFNTFGNFLALSQGDAHSWVEVYLPDGGWYTRDATPAGQGPPRDGWTAAMLAYTDALRLRWYKYVIEYDLARQLRFFERVRTGLTGVFGSGPDAGSTADGGRDAARGAGLPEGALWGAVALGLAVLGVVVLRRRRRGERAGPGLPSSPRGESVAEIYRRLVAAYTALGHARPASSTAREFVALLERRAAPGLDTAREVVALYEAARFGDVAPDGADLRRLRAEIERLRSPPAA
jgi:transglutaminase-like putative cysteine protease